MGPAAATERRRAVSGTWRCGVRAGESDSGPLSKAEPRRFDGGWSVGWRGREVRAAQGFGLRASEGRKAMGQIRGVVSCSTKLPLETQAWSWADRWS